MRGYLLKDLEFLRSNTQITAITIVSPASGAFDVQPLLSLAGLRALTISAPLPLQLAAFPKLEELRSSWDPKTDLRDCHRLCILDLSGYKPKTKDLAGIPALPQLRELVLVQPSIGSLVGVSKFPMLARLEITNASRLESLEGIEGLPSLEALHCLTCRRLGDHTRIVEVKSLRSVRFNDCGEIASLRFLAKMPNLNEFRFVGTNIVDGDLRPLLALSHVGFLPKKHYTHTPAELDAILRAKGGSAIPRLE